MCVLSLMWLPKKIRNPWRISGFGGPVALCFFAVVPSAMADGAGEQILGRAIADEVREIFRANCVECHGADVLEPKGEFGYVLDLGRVAADSAKVVPGRPDDSELYLLIRDEEMPGENARSGPLDTAQKELVRR